MQGFIETNRHDPEKQDVSQRVFTFEEIYEYYSLGRVARQSVRCVQCGDPFCTTIGCPLGNYIPQWLEAIAEKDLKRAFLLSNETSPFPEVLGRICPHNRVCEGACTLDDGYGAITIGPIEASITDLGFAAGYEIPFPGITSEKKVAVVGSGPAGISCAHFLLRAGIGVDMFERTDLPGGLLTYGIPGFKLGKEIMERRFKILKKAGLELHLNTEIGHEKPFSELLRDYDAVFLGLGATNGKRAGIPDEDHDHVFLAMEFLTNMQRRLYGKSWMERFGVLGKRVVVIGGGDTAMDCVRTAVRDGASRVTCLYRRDEENMPGSRKEYLNAVEEGVQFMFHEVPKRIVIEKGELVGLDALSTELGEPGEDGRRRIRVIEGSEHSIPADVVIMALGFDMEGHPYLQDFGIETGDWGQVLVDSATGRTSNEKVYAGGDCQRGANLAVTAAVDGRRAALAIMEKLLGGS